MTEPLFLAADWVQPAVAPLYAGVAQPAMLAIKYAASLMSVVYTKFVYMALSIGVDAKGGIKQLVPTQACLSEMGVVASAYADALIDSFPNTIEFFLDQRMATASEGEVSKCSETEHDNLILSGSLKMYYFATTQCNTRYTDGRLIRCSMEDGIRGAEHCGGFKLPEAKFNTNFLCAVDSWVKQVTHNSVWIRRILVSWVEGYSVAILRLVVDPEDATLQSFITLTGETVSEVMGNSLCAIYESNIRIASVASSIISPALDVVYRASGHPVVRGGMSATDPGFLMTSHHSCAAHATTTGPTEGFCSATTTRTACAKTKPSQGSASASTCVWGMPTRGSVRRNHCVSG